MGKNLWEKAYLKHKKEFFHKHPSNSVKFFVEFLKKKKFKFEGNALDLGCGNGRNGLYLAKLGFNVYGVDIVKEALKDFKNTAIREHLSNKIKLFQRDIGEKFPFKNNFFDIAIDINSFPNLISETKRKRYKTELFRVMKKQSYYLIYVYSKNDGYYGPMLKKFPGREEGTIICPDDNIQRKLYTINELKKFFSDKFRSILDKKIKKKGEMFGKMYTREFILLIFQPKK